MSYTYGLCAFLLVQTCYADTDGKRWVWGEGRRRVDDRVYTGLVNGDRKYTGDLVSGSSKPLFQPSSGFGGIPQSSNDKLRYEVTEPPYTGSEQYRPDQYRPERPIVRPIGGYQPVPEYNRPDNYRPQGGFRPTRPIENEYRPIGPGYKPPPPTTVSGPNNRPILTGPVPSWEQHNPNSYKDYDKCKCVHSFNCNTPGIKFGSCDVDKQYCCYRSKGTTVTRPSYNKVRPVLAGPGGPVDGPRRPIRPVGGNYGRPFRPFSEIDRYVDRDRDSNRDLEEAYKKGLESAIYELYDRPREYQESMYSAPPKQGGGYGLYEPSGYYARSASSNITAIPDSN